MTIFRTNVRNLGKYHLRLKYLVTLLHFPTLKTGSKAVEHAVVPRMHGVVPKKFMNVNKVEHRNRDRYGRYENIKTC